MITQLSKSLRETPELNRIFEDNYIAIYSCNPAYEDWKDKLYLKIFTKDNSGNYITITRLSMLAPEYINCEYDNYILSNNDIDLIIKILNMHRDGEEYMSDDNITLWQLAILSNNIYRKLENNDIPMNLPIPDYSLLKNIE